MYAQRAFELDSLALLGLALLRLARHSCFVLPILNAQRAFDLLGTAWRCSARRRVARLGSHLPNQLPQLLQSLDQILVLTVQQVRLEQDD